MSLEDEQYDLEDLKAYTDSFSYPIDEAKVEQCRQRCQDHDHPFIGPVLQYQNFDRNLGRYLILCHGEHPGDPLHPDPHFLYVSNALDPDDRRKIVAYQAEHHIKIPKKNKKTVNGRRLTQPKPKPPPPPKKSGNLKAPRAVKKKHKPTPAPQVHATPAPFPIPDGIPVSSASPIDLTRDSRSPSVEVVTPPVKHLSLLVHFFFADSALPITLKLYAQKNSTHFSMSSFVTQWLDAEVKQSDVIRILSFADSATAIESWTPFTLSTLSLPRSVPVIVAARPKVKTFHASLSDLYQHAFHDADKLANALKKKNAQLA
ncbi:unnamed protein product [Peniophora sp. CBMAI 1063]|nr:unnamed protein product [Peniophora sp. CBMAI 1063]